MRAAFIALTTATALTASTLALAGAPAKAAPYRTAALRRQRSCADASAPASRRTAPASPTRPTPSSPAARRSRPARKDRLVTHPAPHQRALALDAASLRRPHRRQRRVPLQGRRCVRQHAVRVPRASPPVRRPCRAPWAPTASRPTWKLKFDDQFSGLPLDHNKWAYRQLGLRQAGRSKVAELHPARCTSQAAPCTSQVRKHPNRGRLPQRPRRHAGPLQLQVRRRRRRGSSSRRAGASTAASGRSRPPAPRATAPRPGPAPRSTPSSSSARATPRAGSRTSCTPTRARA